MPFGGLKNGSEAFFLFSVPETGLFVEITQVYFFKLGSPDIYLYIARVIKKSAKIVSPTISPADFYRYIVSSITVH